MYDGAPELSSKISTGGLLATISGLLAGLFTGGLAWVAAAGLAGGITAANRDALKALAKGLGGYKNTDIIDLNLKNADPMTLHKMVRFYDKHGELKAAFTNGYRMDNHYLNDDEDKDGLTDNQEARLGTNVHLLDTDDDGVTDAIEIKTESNATNQNITPWATTNGLSYFDETPMLITAEVIENGERTIKGIALTPELKNDGVYYTVSEVIANLGVPTPLTHDDTLAENNLAVIMATAGDDHIEVGKGKVLIQSGEGKDTILFTELSRIAYLNDFDPIADKLVFTQNVFSERDKFQYDQAQGHLSYDNAHIATFEQGLALDIQRIELI